MYVNVYFKHGLDFSIIRFRSNAAPQGIQGIRPQSPRPYTIPIAARTIFCAVTKLSGRVFEQCGFFQALYKFLLDPSLQV